LIKLLLLLDFLSPVHFIEPLNAGPELRRLHIVKSIESINDLSA
jgi:hypothetical protein